MKSEMLEFAKKLNIEYTGVAPVMRYSELSEILTQRQKKYGLSEFEEQDVEKRVNPVLAFPWAKSIIVCLFPYYTGESADSNISKYAQIPDYHNVVKNKLNKICDYINSKVESHCEVFCDTGVLHDRYLAYLAGLAVRGVNTCMINEKYGSYFFIGYIVTDLELENDKPKTASCIKCGKCKDACPGKAIDGDFHIDVKKCVSYITQLKLINEEQRKILNSQDMVYGCDRCQEVCPHNENIPKTPILEFYEKSVTKLTKEELENLSNRAFKEEYGDFPFSWRGKSVILKNFDK